MTILPRFHATATSEGPAVIDRAQGLRATFDLPMSAQRVASLLNANPAMVDAFYWSNNEGADQ